MTPDINDQFTYVAVDTKTNLESPGYTMGDNTINCADLSKWVVASDNTAVYFAIDVVDDSGVRINGTYTEWKGIVSGNTIGSLQLQAGFVDQDYADSVNTRVYMVITQSWANALMGGLLALMNQDSTLKAEVVGTTQLQPASVTTAKLANDAVTPAKMLGIDLFGLGSVLDDGGVAVPSAGGGQFYIQTGTVVVVTNGSGSGSFTWPTPFPNGLVTAVAVEGDATAGNNHFRLLSSTKVGTSFNFQGMGVNNVRVNYIAIGF